MPGQLDDPAYEMMRGHKAEVRLKHDVAGHRQGDVAMVMFQLQGGPYAELRFRGDNRTIVVQVDDYEPA